MKKVKGVPTITIKTVPHPDPEKAIDVMSQLVLKEMNKEENNKK